MKKLPIPENWPRPTAPGQKFPPPQPAGSGNHPGLFEAAGARPFVHLVYFWFTPEAPADLPETMARECDQHLRLIPGVNTITWGKPAMVQRPVVDNSYDFALCIFFSGRADHDAYQTHPSHVRFTTTYKPFWKKVQVYDFQ